MSKLSLALLPLVIAGVARLEAQTQCTSNGLSLWSQTIAETVPTLEPACSFSNCVMPFVSSPVLRPASMGGGTYQIELLLGVRAPHNEEAADTNPNGTLDILWATGSSVPVFTTN